MVVRNDLAGWNEVDPERQFADARMLPADRDHRRRSDRRSVELVHEHPLITYVAVHR